MRMERRTPDQAEPAPQQEGGALDGVVVCDFSWVGAGPRATKELADHGAEVIKIESRHRLDPSRRTPPFRGKPGPDSGGFFVMSNTSKRSITLNLSDPRGVDLARRLALKSDMVVENFGKGFMERIGLDYDSLRTERADLIMVSVSIAGRTGPLSDFRGYGNSAAATSGQAMLTGFPGGEPHLTNYAFGDVATPLFAAIGMMGALEYRRRTGRGLYVDVAQLDSMMYLLGEPLAAMGLTGQAPGPMGNRHDRAAPHGVFACKGEEQWLAIAIRDDADWRAFCDLAGIEDAADTAQRLADPDRYEAMLADWAERHEVRAAETALIAAGIPAAKVQDGREVSEDPQLAHRRLAEMLDHPVMGPVRHVAPAFALSATPARVTPAPVLGADTADVLRAHLGLRDAEITELEAAGVLA